jgi:hypothetical protein
MGRKILVREGLKGTFFVGSVYVSNYLYIRVPVTPAVALRKIKEDIILSQMFSQTLIFRGAAIGYAQRRVARTKPMH